MAVLYTLYYNAHVQYFRYQSVITKYLPIPMVDLMYICVYPLDWAHTSFKVPTELIATDLICK